MNDVVHATSIITVEVEMNSAEHEYSSVITVAVEMNSTVHECSSAITVAVEMKYAVHKCSSAIRVALKTNTEQSIHNPPAVCVVQVALRSGRKIDAW